MSNIPVRKYSINKENLSVCKSMIEELKNSIKELEVHIDTLEKKDIIETDEKLWIDLVFCTETIEGVGLYLGEDTEDTFFQQVFEDPK